jgi:hypothetical protein
MRPAKALTLAWRTSQVLSKLKPAAIILNSGIWKNASEVSPEFARQLAEAATAAVAQQDGLVIWRTTTPTLKKLPKQKVNRTKDSRFLEAAARVDPPFHVMDAWQMMQPLLAYKPPPFYDSYHPYPEVYSELSIVLLNMLC